MNQQINIITLLKQGIGYVMSIMVDFICMDLV